nr:uncharacterized protein LOC127340088 [Lolium perenne]
MAPEQAVEATRASPVKRSAGGFADEDDLFDIDEGVIEPSSKKAKSSAASPDVAASEASAPKATPTAQASTASSLSKGKDVPSAATVVTPPSDLRAEKEQLAQEHRKALAAQETISAELKDQLVQAELRHSRELKEAQAASEAKLDESLKEFTNSSAVLRVELEEETVARKAAQDRIATLTTDQAEYDRLVMQADALALRLFPESQPHAHKKVTERRAEQAMSNPAAP